MYLATDTLPNPKSHTTKPAEFFSECGHDFKIKTKIQTITNCVPPRQRSTQFLLQARSTGREKKLQPGLGAHPPYHGSSPPFVSSRYANATIQEKRHVAIAIAIAGGQGIGRRKYD